MIMSQLERDALKLAKVLRGLASLEKAFPGTDKDIASLGSPILDSRQLISSCPLCRAAPSATQITEILPHSSGELLYLGTESGNVFVVQLPGFRMLDNRTICSDAVLQW